MKISHEGEVVLLGKIRLGPGSARAFAVVVERKASRGDDPVVTRIGAIVIRVPLNSAPKLVAAIRRHSTMAEVVRGPVGRGTLRGETDARQRVDEIFGRLGQLLKETSA